MKFEITTEEILELAKNPFLKKILEEKFPDCFKNDIVQSDDPGIESIQINKGDLCYIVHGTPERFTITKSNFPSCSSGAVKIFRGDSMGKFNSELYVINNTKKYSLKDIEHVLTDIKYDYPCSVSVSKHFGRIISRLNDISNTDTVIHHMELIEGKSFTFNEA